MIHYVYHRKDGTFEFCENQKGTSSFVKVVTTKVTLDQVAYEFESSIGDTRKLETYSGYDRSVKVDDILKQLFKNIKS